MAAGSLSSGIGSILVSGAVWCFGLSGSAGGWGALVAGAFFVLSVLLGVAAVVLGIIALRQIKRAHGVITGRGYGISGLACGGVGLLLAASGLATAIALSMSGS